MKKTIALLFMSAFLFMGATCSTTISGAAVIALVQQTCGIVVPYADIAALVAQNPILTTVDEVANAICNAFKAQSSKLSSGSTPVVSGTLIVDGVLVHYTVK